MTILTLEIRSEHDVVAARQRARAVAELLGFGTTDQTRIATAVSEIARNAFEYAGGGRAEYAVAEQDGEQRFRVVISDDGPGIPHLQEILDGRYRSPHGMGLGIVGTRRILDALDVVSVPGQGTRVTLDRRLPAGHRVDAAELARIAGELARGWTGSPVQEVQEQNRELLRTLEELRARQQELIQLNRELEDTNRGVVALYAELDERVEQLRRSNALRAQFTSYLSHEFRTPLDSMLALSGLLLNRVDGELTEEQEKQVAYIQRSARDLLAMVDDLLDTARVEAGQVQVRPEPFTVADLLSALRATLRPLLTSDTVTLSFAAADGVPPLHTDEAKVTQILRNLISNALKFTERGQILVRAEVADGGDTVVFLVQDTGVGIEPGAQEWIFEDFTRVEGPERQQAKGTGLGLPLSRKLARLLGGDLQVQSEPGRGATFRVSLPRVYTSGAGGNAERPEPRQRTEA